MPILNAGTVVENIALIEAARLVFEEPPNTNEPVEFVNSLSRCLRSLLGAGLATIYSMLG
jgi:hypothetical protein